MCHNVGQSGKMKVLGESMGINYMVSKQEAH